MRVRAFAKINLSLRVLGLRPDGYHELRTIFQSIALHDTLTIRRVRGAFEFAVDDPACPADRMNLIWRAAERVWEAAGRHGAPRGVAIDLSKRVPIQAGLGGGSSDAAAAVRALGAIWRVDLARQREIAAALGADVPYFFEGGTVLGLDRGDLLYPLPDRLPAWVVLVLPPFGVSTKEAFQWYDAQAQGRGRRDRARSAKGPASQNDLEIPVARRHPEIVRIISTLRRLGASEAAMSGSGPAVFGLFGSRPAAAKAAAALAGHKGAVGIVRRAFITRTLNRRSYQRLAAN